MNVTKKSIETLILTPTNGELKVWLGAKANEQLAEITLNSAIVDLNGHQPRVTLRFTSADQIASLEDALRSLRTHLDLARAGVVSASG